MKIKNLPIDYDHLITGALANNRQAQKMIYEQFSPKMLGTCRKYIQDMQHAEDVMLGGFIKVFKKLDTYNHKGSFEGWVRRIMVNESISFLRSKKRIIYSEDEMRNLEAPAIVESDLSIEEIQGLIDQLPEGAKLVFNMYVMEDYPHKEIALKLNISVGTSKSQLAYARKILKSKLLIQNTMQYGK